MDNSDRIRLMIRAAAKRSHLDWARMCLQWTQKQSLLLSPHITIICGVIDAVLDGRIKRLLINMPPRHGKTLLGVQALSSRLMAVNPSAKILHLSYSDMLVQKNSREVQQVIQAPQFYNSFPTLLSPGSKAKRHWNTTGGGEFHAVPSSSEVTGFECGIAGDPWDGMLLIDDPENASAMSSIPYRNAKKDTLGQAISTRLNHDDTPVIVIQQRLHQDDCSNWLLTGGTGDRWTTLCFVADGDGTPPEHYKEYSHCDLINYKMRGGALWPERKPLEALYRIRDAQEDKTTDEPRGKRVFAAQYQQAPASVELALFEAGWLDYYNHESLPWSLSNMEIRIDTAEKGTGKSDYTGLSVIGTDKRDRQSVYLLDVDRERLEFPALVDWVISHAIRLSGLQTQTLKLTKITIEDANIGAALASVLRVRLKEEGVPISVKLTKRYGNKFERAMEVLPYLQQRRLKVPWERTRFVHPRRSGEGEMEKFKAFADEFKTFNEADTHLTDDILDTVIWHFIENFVNKPKASRFD